MGMTPRVVVNDLEQLQRTFADVFQARALDVLSRRERCTVGLPGGSVASAFFPVLLRLAVDWSRFDIFWIDERAVPPEHADSNYGMALRMLLVPARVPAARIHRMQGELPEIEQAARRATDELRSIAGDPPALDLVLAGVGEDGHVASIFGGRSAPSSGAKTDPVVAVHDSPRPPPRRLTLTLDVLSGAGLVIVAAFGASKAAAMRDALERSGATTPVAELLRRAISPVVLLDREAAGLLRDTYSLS
jgi:6-phosphogluconolactonase